MNSCFLGDVCDGLRYWKEHGVTAQCLVTSPPYWGLRDYGVPPSDWPAIEFTPMPGIASVSVPAWKGQLGHEPDPLMFTAHLVHVFRLARDVLADDGVAWVNMGDGYAGARGGGQGKHGALAGRAASIRGVRERNRAMTGPGLKPKDLVGQPWRLAFALQADGWYLRQDIIWHKPNPMPESVLDRCTKSHEYLMVFTKSSTYYWDGESIQEPAKPESDARYERGRSDSHKWSDGGPGNQSIAKSFEHMRKSGNKERKAPTSRGVPVNADGKTTGHVASSVPWEGSKANKRSVWTVSTKPFSGAHFAVFPPDLIEPCILATTRPGDVVLDQFMGSGTTAMVAQNLGRRWIGCELNPEYHAMQLDRVSQQAFQL